MNFVWTNARTVTMPLFRVGVPAAAFPLFQVLTALGLKL